MKLSILALFLAFGSMLPAQSDKPNVFLGDGKPPKKDKNVIERPVHGIVKDAAGIPVAQALVRLKNLKTNKEIQQITRTDGTYRFDELKMSEDYELQARYKDTISVVKKLSIYDPRRDPVLNFDLEPRAQSGK